MPVKVETTHIILPRELIVYLRSDSDVWQCRLKVDNKWMARTTKERDVNKAVERAKRASPVKSSTAQPAGRTSAPKGIDAILNSALDQMGLS